MVEQLGPYHGVYEPDYRITIYKDGDPRQLLRHVNLRSVTAIQTSKNLSDLAGTFTITLKDEAARHYVNEMDVVVIKLRGHDPQFATVWKGVVDEVRQGGEADLYASAEDTVISGRCLTKYLMETSLFLPVWDPTGLLPTALIFGLGDVLQKTGNGINKSTPRDIFRYILQHYTYGRRDLAGTSAIPNSRFWLDAHTRFHKVPFVIPFLQFDEDTVATALKRLEVLGYTEAWVDELGRIVYRHPAWDAPVSYSLPTGSLKDWSFPHSDVDVATYVEVIPGGDPGIDSSLAQALRAGRAPVPSAYVDSAGKDSIAGTVSREFIIQTDKKGIVTKKGRKNHWYRLQRHLGLRPQQITSPLLFYQEQAQRQAEGLLRFFTRFIKSGQITLPGEPRVRLGATLRLHGELRGLKTDRTYYIESVTNEYVEGSHYDTTVGLTHGRDPWDPKWGEMTLPKFDISKISTGGGILDPGGPASNLPAGEAPFVPKGAKFTWQRIDQGLDGNLARPGGPLIAFADGVVHIHGPDPGGFGNAYPSLEVKSGSLDGKEVYYGHCTPTVSEGARVKQGDVICHTHTHSGDGNGGPGHFEIGLWPPGSMTDGKKLAPYMNYPHGIDPNYP